jgi:hypothetical protein
MSDIAAVVARSRLAGEFSERRTFTLARTRAIQKMRQFALADPYYFVLELIQAAVANGATYINVASDASSFTLSYSRGFFRAEELGQLFDFLFAGKDRADIGHVRELALGVNALLLFEPDRIVVESGDGTAEGTTRLVVNKNAENVDIGRSKLALSGTYIRAENLHRRAVRNKTSLEPLLDLPLEAAAIEERCLTAPIPVLVNDKPMFGFATQAIPRLLGYQRTLEFDEGDLFGSLGIHPQGFTPSFKLLTFGVWIQSVSQNLLPGVGVGGIVCFDRLRKTADHSGIVHDDLWQEMWARLRPYAEQLQSGATGVIRGAVTLLSGASLTAREVRPLLRACDRVVLVASTVGRGSREGLLAHEIGASLDAMVIRASAADEAWLRGLAGAEVSLLRPNLADGQDHAFFSGQQPCEIPARPWLAPPVALATLDSQSMIRDIVLRYGASRAPVVETEAETEGETSPGEKSEYHERLGEGARLRRVEEEANFVLGGVGEISATVYSPEAPPSTTRLTVQLVTVDRLVFEIQLLSDYPGHVLRVVLPDASPSRLRRPLGDPDSGAPLVEHIARSLVLWATAALRSAAGKALARKVDAQGSGPPVLRAIALASLSRSLVSRFQMDDKDVPRVRLSLVEGAHAEELLERPLLPTLGGTWLSMRDVERLLEQTGGLIYGVIPTVPPALEGLDSSHILQLNQEEERLLISLFGDAAYVRVDRRDVLAEHRGLQCRDLALGLARYGDFPLLVEGVDPTDWPEDQRRAAVEGLVMQLASGFLGLEPACPTEGALVPEWEENRRQACRHLQWFICHHAARRDRTEPDYGVGDLPLFLDPEGRAWTYREVALALDTDEGLRLCFRPAFGGSQLGALTAAAAGGTSPEVGRSTPRDLAASPLTALLLSGLGNVHVALDFELPHEVVAEPPGEPDNDVDFLQRCEVTGRGYHGHVGLPAVSTSELQIHVLEPATGRVHAHRKTALSYGMVGLVRLVTGTLDESLGRSISDDLRMAGEKLIAGLARQLTTLEPDSVRYRQSVNHLLAFAGSRLQLLASSELQPTPTVIHPVAQEVLAMPLFPTASGSFISGERLIDAFCTFGAVLPDDPAQVVKGREQVTLAPDAPDHLVQWVRTYLKESRVVRPASARSAPLPAVMQRADRPADEAIALSVEYWLEELRPDRLGDAAEDLLAVPRADGKRLPIRVLIRSGEVFANFTKPTDLMAYTYFERIPTALLNGDHWLVCWAREQLQSDPHALAALLLACYAHINALLDPVTNLHERVFQLHLAEALEAHRLGPVTQRT